MTTKARQELVYRALTELGRRYGGEAPDATDYEEVDDLVDPLVEQLAADQVVYIDNTDAIEAAFFLPLGRLLAVVAAGTFGESAISNLLTRNRATNVDQLQAREEATLRRIQADKPAYETLKVKYY